ncbi:hypothetical protein C2S52_006144 [Perilla frutescens var. hirtella]|nr:hypothetical protein C2S52_006144 [Perilla frutescens var. hirtella]
MAKPPNVVIIPYPAQGHINPSLAFAESLAAKGLIVTFVVTTALSMSANIYKPGSITIHDISDGYEHVKEPETVEAYLSRMKTNLSHNLAQLLDQGWAKVIIYDSLMPWVLDIAHERGLLGASFFTQSCAACAVYYHLKEGLVRFPYQDSTVSLPALPTLGMNDLPCFSHALDSQQTAVDILANQFLNLERADWIFFNTFYKLESEVVDWMASRWPVKTIGPTYLLVNKTERFSNKSHMINMFEPKHEACREWMDSRETGSVVYVSFGSLASFGKEQMEEVAYGLIMSNCPFLWVVRSSEIDKLPRIFDSLDSKKGLIVEWCHQPQVLAHHALACFMTHCGWNSTLEALSHGVPLVAMAQRYDQTTNAKFIEDVWRIGIGVKSGENGIIGREEIAMRIKQVVEGDEGIELKKNACKWKELADEAVEIGGTSANNVEEFVSKLMNS